MATHLPKFSFKLNIYLTFVGLGMAVSGAKGGVRTHNFPVLSRAFFLNYL